MIGIDYSNIFSEVVESLHCRREGLKAMCTIKIFPFILATSQTGMAVKISAANPIIISKEIASPCCFCSISLATSSLELWWSLTRNICLVPFLHTVFNLSFTLSLSLLDRCTSWFQKSYIFLTLYNQHLSYRNIPFFSKITWYHSIGSICYVS